MSGHCLHWDVIIAFFTVVNLSRVSSQLGWRLAHLFCVVDVMALFEKNPVTHFVDFIVLPNYQEDEGMPLPSAEKYMRIVLVREASEGPNTSRQSRA